ncbi:RNA polymerase subunit sigma-70, partial [Patulibacter sp. S7RM1-6]
GAAAPAADPVRARALVDAFLAATREGDLGRLVATLAPDVVLQEDFGPAAGGLRVHRGAKEVASRAVTFAELARQARPATVNGAAGLVAVRAGAVRSVLAFDVVAGRIAAIDVLADRARLTGLDHALQRAAHD